MAPSGPVRCLVALSLLCALLMVPLQSTEACDGYVIKFDQKLQSCSKDTIMVPVNSTAKLTEKCELIIFGCFKTKAEINEMACTWEIKKGPGTLKKEQMNGCTVMQQEYETAKSKNQPVRMKRLEKFLCPIQAKTFACLGQRADISTGKGYFTAAKDVTIEVNCNHGAVGKSCMRTTFSLKKK